MRTVALPDGSVVPVVDLKAIHVHRHFWKSDEYYVQAAMRGGQTQDVIEHLSSNAAHTKRDELVSLMQQAWEEVGPYEHGLHRGREEGRLEGYSDGFNAGKSEVVREGQTAGSKVGSPLLAIS